MKKAIDRKQEKRKWLAALCLCLLCFSLCVGMLAGPAYAAVALTPLKDIERIEAAQWGSHAPGSNKDSFGNMQANSYVVGGFFEADKPGVIGSARYKLDKRYAELSGTLACADASTNHAAMRLKVYADGKADAIYTSEPILRATRPVTFKVDVRNVSVLKMELIQMEVDYPTPPQGTPAGFALLVNPVLETVTTPSPTAPVPLKDVTLLAAAWDIAYGSNKDSLGNTQENSAKIGGEFDKAGTLGWSLHQLDKKYSRFIGKLACAEAGDADALMQVKFYADGAATPFYTSAQIKRDTQPFDFSVSVSNVTVLKIELLDAKGTQLPLKAWALLINPLLESVPPPEPTTTTTAPSTSTSVPLISYTPVAGWTGLYKRSPALTSGEFIYSFTRNPATDSPLLRVYAKSTCPEVKAVGDITILKYYGAFNGADLVLMALKGVSCPAAVRSVTVGGYMFTIPAAGELYVCARNSCYSLAEAYERQGILRAEDIVAMAGIINAAAPTLPTLTPAQELKIKQDFLGCIEPEYYVNVLRNNVYARLNRDGTADFNTAGAVIWAGSDAVIGTVDDKILVLREGSYFYEESAGVWKFVVSRYDYEDPRWAGIVMPTTTTTAPTTTTTGPTGGIEPTTTTTNGYLTTANGGEGPPKTGVPRGAGLWVCMAVLFMGCAYCGYRVIKKERA